MNKKKNKKAQQGIKLINPTYEESGIYDSENPQQLLGDLYQPQDNLLYNNISPNHVSTSWSIPSPTEYSDFSTQQSDNSSDRIMKIAGYAQQGMKQLGNISKGAMNMIPALTSLIPEQQRTRRNILINDNQPRPHSQAIMNNGGVVERIADNPIDGPTMLLKGPSHEKGGIPLNIFGQNIEAEGQETIHFANDGMQIESAVIGGNLSTKYNGKKTKFKNIFKDIADKDSKANKQENKGLELILDNEPSNPFQALAFNSGKVLTEGAYKKYENNSIERDYFTQIQNSMLEAKDNKAKDGKTIYAKNGSKIDRENLLYRQIAHSAANNAQIDPNLFSRLVETESSWNPQAKSNAGAKGIVQFMPKTAKQYGLTEKQLSSTDPNDIEAVMYAGAQHLSSLLNKYDGDYDAALLAYNGGEGGYEKMKDMAVKRLDKSKDQLTGADVLTALRIDRRDNPQKPKSAFSQQSLDYVVGIRGYDPDQDFSYQGAYQNSPLKRYPSMAESYGDNNSNAREPYPQDMERIPMRDSNPLPLNITPESVQQNIPNLDNTFRNIQNEVQGSNITSQQRTGSLADSIGLPWSQIAATAPAIFDRPDFVDRQYYNPILEDPYSVSLQDQRNQVNSAFRSMERQLPNNPEALAALAGQRYQAENQISANEFRTNQELLNTTLNRNVQTLNQAQQLNNQYSDLQMDRQTRAKAITDDRRQQALSSLATAFDKQRQLKTNIHMLEATTPYAYNTQTNAYDLVRPELDPINYSGIPAANQPTRQITKTTDGKNSQTNVFDSLKLQEAQRRANMQSHIIRNSWSN